MLPAQDRFRQTDSDGSGESRCHLPMCHRPLLFRGVDSPGQAAAPATSCTYGRRNGPSFQTCLSSEEMKEAAWVQMTSCARCALPSGAASCTRDREWMHVCALLSQSIAPGSSPGKP